MMIVNIDITNMKVAEAILKLQLESYRIEAELIDFYEIPPLLDTIDTLRNCGETFLGYVSDGEIVGAISFKKNDTLLDIHRLMVDPNHFKKGIARKLLNYVECFDHQITEMTVSTGTKNIPAINLYNHFGFQKVNELIVADHLSTTVFKKQL